MNKFSYGIENGQLVAYLSNISDTAMHLACSTFRHSTIFQSATFDQMDATIRFKCDDLDQSVNALIDFITCYQKAIKSLKRLEALKKDLNNEE